MPIIFEKDFQSGGHWPGHGHIQYDGHTGAMDRYVRSELEVTAGKAHITAEPPVGHTGQVDVDVLWQHGWFSEAKFNLKVYDEPIPQPPAEPDTLTILSSRKSWQSGITMGSRSVYFSINLPDGYQYASAELLVSQSDNATFTMQEPDQGSTGSVVVWVQVQYGFFADVSFRVRVTATRSSS